MEVGSTTDVKKSNQIALKSQETVDKAADDAGDDQSGVAQTDFSEFMRTALGGVGKAQVSEEELFAAIVDQRLNAENPEASTFFREQKAALMTSMAKPDGYVSHEDVAVQALRATVAANKIDMATAEEINGQAFQAAQLDTTLDSLYDDRGGGDDPTIAVAEMDSALGISRTMIEAFDAGTQTAVSRSLDTPINVKPAAPGGAAGAGGSSSGVTGSGGPVPTGAQPASDGGEGFLWKPESDSNGKLVVLLPSEFANAVDRVEIHSDLPPTSATKLAEGKFSSIGNGDRPHYRFDKEGGEYGDNVHVVVFNSDGTTTTYDIDNGSERID